MNPDIGLGSSMLFNILSSDLNASLATADELSREFDSLMKECSSSVEPEPERKEKQRSSPEASLKVAASSGSSLSTPPVTITPVTIPTPVITKATPPVTEPCLRPVPVQTSLSNTKPFTPPPVFSPCPSPQPFPTSVPFKDRLSPAVGQQTLPRRSPHAPRRAFQYDSVPRDHGKSGYTDWGPSPCSSPLAFDSSFHLKPHPSPPAGPPFDPSRRPPRPDGRVLTRPYSQSSASTLPRNFGFGGPASEWQTVPTAGSEMDIRRQKSLPEWNEMDADLRFGLRPQHHFEKAERLRAYGQNHSWKEGRQNSLPLVFSKESLSHQPKVPNGSLPRNIRLHPTNFERSSSSSSSSCPSPPVMSTSSYKPQRAPMSRMAPPSSPWVRWHRPVPLSIIMRAQNPPDAMAITRHPRAMELEGEGPNQQAPPTPQQKPSQSAASEQKPPMPQTGPEKQAEKEEGDPAGVPRPLSPTQLPTVAPEGPGNCPELLLLRSEIPRPLKKRDSWRGGAQKLPQLHRRQYQQMIRKLFHRRDLLQRAEPGSESSSSSEGEEPPKVSPAVPKAPVQVTPQQKGHQSILRRPGRERKGCGKRARLSPLVLLLDGALVGELDTVQRAVKELSDPSLPNEEGVTALHNAICEGHYSIVDFLVQNGANVSVADSHGWTPLHCAASCNDRSMCEYLVRNGAAVLSVTAGDGATAVQKCDPYAPAYEECEGFLRGVEEAMGVENDGVLYALWGYTAQAADELSFQEGDAVTIKNKQEGEEWWWASLGNREGFVPNNYFSLFRKVQPKPLLDQNQKAR
ncbi:hypothetical protein AGOR_G00030390 [Albula goreensis]|uniref:SH3 domain-containing protein n=1 Tax=Albula goreensis TaxID=1534307 RepID=A0A8T3E665_9TELE|nr:hypothetical protein AGOR_G00030390 [Albula goreensis]